MMLCEANLVLHKLKPAWSKDLCTFPEQESGHKNLIMVKGMNSQAKYSARIRQLRRSTRLQRRARADIRW
jgi:hypothetical protein